MRGRICFESRPQFQDLEQFADEGAQIKKTTLTEQFTLDDFRKMYGERTIILFLDNKEKGLHVSHCEMKEPSAGTTVYAMIPSQETIIDTNVNKSDDHVSQP